VAITRYGLTGPLAASPGFAAKDEGGVEEASALRRGKQGRGRARLRGRRMWWLVLLLLPHWT
jgi:hypothetical protein